MTATLGTTRETALLLLLGTTVWHTALDYIEKDTIYHNPTVDVYVCNRGFKLAPESPWV